jgi:Holliday junction resolvase-like predicted endonuclease
MSSVCCYVTVPDITNLKERITDAFATITEYMLENRWRETDYRFDVLRATKGAHVEVYQSVAKNFLS